MKLILPEPGSIDKIALMYGLNRYWDDKKEWLVKGLDVSSYIHKLKSDRILFSTPTYHKLNMYFLYRSMHQINEACNKLWSTIELYLHVRSNELFCKSFKKEFLGSSTVPTLHYANMSAIISILTLYGICSWVDKGQKVRYYNIIRTGKQLYLIERTKWLVDTFGTAKSGWHTQILQTYSGLSTKGISLPPIDIEKSKMLLSDRAKMHYDILGQTSMNFTYGFDSFFKNLQTVMNSIEIAIVQLHKILKPLPNGCDSRFKDISKRASELRSLYGLKS